MRARSEAQESVTEPTSSVSTEVVRQPRGCDPRPCRRRCSSRPDPGSLPGSDRVDEASLIATLHDLAASDPPESLRLAREGSLVFPMAPTRPRLEWNVVKALANMDRYQEAEEEARSMLEKYPDNPFSIDVEHHILNHPPNPTRTP